MLSIGEFSKICEVSTKTLRYYDEIGLIKPDQTNPENGYRYYSITQLKSMLLINRLKSYHFSLDEIKTLFDLEADQAEEVLRAALQNKQREIQAKQAELEFTLKQIGGDILKLEKGIPIMAYLNDIEVELVDTPDLNILSLRLMMHSADYADGYGQYFSRLYARIAAEKLTPLGAPLTIYHSPEYNPDGNDTEFAIPVRERVTGTRDFPGGLHARSVLRGPYTQLTSLYARLREWMENKGYELVDSPYEIYLTDPYRAAVPEDMLTEVYYPVKKK